MRPRRDDEPWTGEAPCDILHCMRTSAVLAGLLAASPAFAQQVPIATWQSPQSRFVSAQPWSSPLVSNLQLTAPWLRGEPTGPAGISSWVLSTPLRLSLQGGIPSIAGARVTTRFDGRNRAQRARLRSLYFSTGGKSLLTSSSTASNGAMRAIDSSP